VILYWWVGDEEVVKPVNLDEEIPLSWLPTPVQYTVPFPPVFWHQDDVVRLVSLDEEIPLSWFPAPVRYLVPNPPVWWHEDEVQPFIPVSGTNRRSPAAQWMRRLELLGLRGNFNA